MTFYQHLRHARDESPDIASERRALARLRAEIEGTLHRMIEMLDAIDGDPDLEPNAGTDASTDECEPDADAEPSLGAPEPCHSLRAIYDSSGTFRGWEPNEGSQLSWSAGACDDREDEHCGAEPDEETGELESDPAERGIGDYDGLIEQAGGLAFGTDHVV